MIKYTKSNLIVLVIFSAIFLLDNRVLAQSQFKFEKRTIRETWTDKAGKPLNYDAEVQLKLSADQFDQIGGVTEITADGLTYNIQDSKSFPILKDSAGNTFAQYDVLVFADKDDSIKYDISLIDKRTGQANGLTNGTKSYEEYNRKSGNASLKKTQKYNKIVLMDWLIICGTLLLSGLLLYFLVSRLLFKTLLMKYKWTTTKAEHFTWSITLLGMLAISAVLAVTFIGPRIETWFLVGVVAMFWILHAIVWAVSRDDG